jgi:hypothetical protein
MGRLQPELPPAGEHAVQGSTVVVPVLSLPHSYQYYQFVMRFSFDFIN